MYNNGLPNIVLNPQMLVPYVCKQLELGHHCACRSPDGNNKVIDHGPLARCVKLWGAHAPGIPVTLSLPPRVCDPDIHHGTCVAHVPCCMPGSLTSGFLWSRWRGKRSRHSRRMRNPQFYVSDKRLIVRHTATFDARHVFQEISMIIGDSGILIGHIASPTTATEISWNLVTRRISIKSSSNIICSHISLFLYN